MEARLDKTNMMGMEYKKPSLISLQITPAQGANCGSGTTASGYCDPTGNAADTHCESGGTAGWGCDTGTINAASCDNGTRVY